LVEELEEDALHFAIGARLRVEALRRDRIDLVDEDDRGRVLACQPEHVSHLPEVSSEPSTEHNERAVRVTEIMSNNT
jgi:hypothetical protein